MVTTMSRLATCPKCRNQFGLPELTGPATIACPFCAAHINIKIRQTVPPPAMVVQPAVAMTQVMPEEDDDEEEEERPRKKKKQNKKKKKKVVYDDEPGDENWLKASILMGVFLVAVIALVGAFVWFIYSAKSGPAVIMPTALKNINLAK
jgi:DNA-directed RNA polymerase subunit RPC12/RpoP